MSRFVVDLETRLMAPGTFSPGLMESFRAGAKHAFEDMPPAQREEILRIVAELDGSPDAVRAKITEGLADLFGGLLSAIADAAEIDDDQNLRGEQGKAKAIGMMMIALGQASADSFVKHGVRGPCDALGDVVYDAYRVTRNIDPANGPLPPADGDLSPHQANHHLESLRRHLLITPADAVEGVPDTEALDRVGRAAQTTASQLVRHWAGSIAPTVPTQQNALVATRGLALPVAPIMPATTAAPPKRRMSLDERSRAIRDYFSGKSTAFAAYKKAIEQDRPGALQQARDLFGATAVAVAIGTGKSGAGKVCENKAWKAKAEELGIRGTGRIVAAGGARVGLDIALEAQAAALADSPDDEDEEDCRAEPDRDTLLRQLKREQASEMRSEGHRRLR